MASSLGPVLLTLDANTHDDNSKSKKALSIFQSRRVIDDLENSLEESKVEDHSSLLHTNRQVVEGMIVDIKQFDESSKIRQQLLCRDAEDNENVILSFMTLEGQKGNTKKVIYRWKRKPYYKAGSTHAVHISQEEHIYQGMMEGNRKHGEGQYILLQKLSDNTEKSTRYTGIWKYDIFVSGTIEDANGFRKQIMPANIGFKTRSNLKAKVNSNRNLTIKHVSAMMEQKKSSKMISGVIPSSGSIERAKSKRGNRVVII